MIDTVESVFNLGRSGRKVLGRCSSVAFSEGLSLGLSKEMSGVACFLRALNRVMVVNVFVANNL